MLSAFPEIVGPGAGPARARAPRPARRPVRARSTASLVWETPTGSSTSSAPSPRSTSSSCSRSARARPGGPTASTTSARCGRSPGSSAGRRTGRSCRPGTAAGPRSPPPTSASCARLYAELPFFRSLIDNLEMTLAKSSLEVAREYLELVPAELGAERVLRGHRRGARARTVEAVLAIVGEERAARAQPRRPPLDRDPEPLRRPDERDPGRAAPPLPRRRRERAAAARPLDRRDRSGAPQHGLGARRRVDRGACRGASGNRENAQMADAATASWRPRSRAFRAPMRSTAGLRVRISRSPRSSSAGRTRRHLIAIYGYARLVDQIGDAVRGRPPRRARRVRGRSRTGSSPATIPSTRSSAGSRPTVHELDLPRGPFDRLIEANRRDQEIAEYRDFDELVGLLRPLGEPGRRARPPCLRRGDTRPDRALRQDLHGAAARRALAGRRRGPRRRAHLPPGRGPRSLRRRRCRPRRAGRPARRCAS